MLRSALKFVIGAALGLIVWWYGTPAYNGVLAATANVIRADPRFRDARVIAVGRNVEVIRRGAPSRAIPADQLTYNIVLLAGLFATNARFFRDRNIRRLLLSIAIVMAAHWLALLVTIESEYAQRAGDWSEVHYTQPERYVWALAEYFYRLVGMFGIAFACWWLSSDGLAPAADRSRGSRKRPGPR